MCSALTQMLILYAAACSFCIILQVYSVTNINIKFYLQLMVSVITTTTMFTVQDVKMYESHVSEHKVVKYGNLPVYLEFRTL
jgi:hypothetical protein